VIALSAVTVRQPSTFEVKSAVNANIKYTYRKGWLGDKVLDLYYGDFHGFPQSLRANAGVVPRLGHDHLQIITHLSSIHSALYSLGQ
jgi:hypothetical protein